MSRSNEAVPGRPEQHEPLAAAAATITVQLGRSVAVVRVAGKIDMGNLTALREALTSAVDAAARRVLVDLAAVTFLDVGGVGALAVAAARLRSDGRRELVVVDPSEVASRILHLTGVAELITIRTGPNR